MFMTCSRINVTFSIYETELLLRRSYSVTRSYEDLGEPGTCQSMVTARCSVRDREGAVSGKPGKAISDDNGKKVFGVQLELRRPCLITPSELLSRCAVNEPSREMRI